MSVFKTTFSRSLQVIPSGNSVIPSPYSLISSVTTDEATGYLLDASVDFFVEVNGSRQYAVNVGDVVYNTTTKSSATIVEVVDEHTILMNANIISEGHQYTIYQQGAQTGLGNQGCYLYVGTTGDLDVVTTGGDSVLFSNVQAGSVLPVQVLSLKVDLTSASSIIALW